MKLMISFQTFQQVNMIEVFKNIFDMLSMSDRFRIFVH